MPSIQKSEKSDSITIRCSPDLKKAVRIAAAEKATSIENLCAELLAGGLGLLVDGSKRRRA